MNRFSRNILAFTIIELLVVISVLTILISIGIPRIKGFMENAKNVQVQKELKTIEAAIQSYYIMNRAYPPTGTSYIQSQYLTNSTPKVLDRVLYDPFVANGTTQYYSSMGAQTTFAQVERQLDSQGGAGEYDWLCDTNQHIVIQNALGNDFNNGAILYAQNGSMDNLDLARGFKSFTPYQRKYNFTRYLPFTNPAFYGNAAAGTTRDNFGLLIPKSKGQDARTRNIVPQFCIRYQNIPGFGKVVIGETGGLSPNGKTTKLELDVFQQAYYGAMVFGANQWLILKKA